MTANTYIRGQLLPFNKNLKIAHMNVESVVAHLDELREVAQNFDVVALSETFLKPEISDAAVNFENYVWVRNDRTGKGRGGVALLVSSRLRFKELARSPSLYSRSPEFIFIEVECNGYKVVLGVVYRPPKIGKIQEVFELVGRILTSHSNIILLGDFNADMASDSFYKRQLQLLINNYNFQLLPMDTTFHAPSSSSFLDLILVNDSDLISKFGQCHVPGISRHDLIFCACTIKLAKCVEPVKMIRDKRKFNENDFIKAGMDLDWNAVYLESDIDKKVEIFNTLVLELYNKFCPLRKIKPKHLPAPWISDDIRSLMGVRDTAYKRYTRSKTVENRKNYKRLRNQVKQILRNAKNRYFNALFHKNLSSKDLWNIFRGLGISKDKRGGVILPVPVDQLNDHFVHVTGNARVDTAVPDVIQEYISLRPGGISMVLDQVSEERVRECLFMVKSTSLGSDDLSIEILHILADVVTSVLCHIYNKCLETGFYPTQWKRAIVMPLKKVPTPKSANEFRAINLLCAPGKVFDKLIYIELNNYVMSNNLINDRQSAYKASYSAETALICVLDDVRRAMDNRKITIFVGVDFSRAFDLIRHDVLLAILRSFGLSNLLVRLFESYLSGRSQSTRAPDGSLSSWRDVTIGIPQGSVLSGLLFVIFSNSIPNGLIYCSHMLYADDLQLYLSCDVSELDVAIAKVNADLAYIFDWCNKHSMTINGLKSKAMFIGNTRLLTKVEAGIVPPIEIGDNTLEFVQQFKNLGIVVTNTLNWEFQVSDICKKVFRGLYQLRRVAYDFPLHIRAQLAQSLLVPYFEYAPLAFCDLNSEQSDRLQRALNCVVRFVCRLRLDDHVTASYLRLGWLKIAERKKLNMATMLFKILKFQRPVYLFNQFKYLSSIHTLSTRNADATLLIPKHNTILFSKSFLSQSISLHNDSTDLFDLSKTVNSFRNDYKRQLLDNYKH